MVPFTLSISSELLSEIVTFHKQFLQSKNTGSLSETLNTLLKYSIMDTSVGATKIEFIQNYFEEKEWILDRFLFEALKTGHSHLEQEI